MAAAQLEEVDLVEIDHVRRWRFDELLRAGYDIADAADVALRTDIDLHWAVAPGAAGLPERDRCADRAVGALHDASAPFGGAARTHPSRTR